LGGVKMDMFFIGLEIALGVIAAPLVFILLGIMFLGVLAIITSSIAKIVEVFSK
jgi:hypothetical protein